MSKVTAEQFKKYQRYCAEWQDILGLNDWHIYYKQTKLQGCYAQTSYQVSSRTATINLNTSWDEYRVSSNDELRANALHEVLHLLTAPLLVEAEDRFSNQHSIDTAEHSIVVRLTNVITRLTNS